MERQGVQVQGDVLMYGGALAVAFALVLMNEGHPVLHWILFMLLLLDA